MHKITRSIWLILLAFSISACQTMTSKQDWPEDIPARKIFVKAYYEKRDVTKVDDRVMSDHLAWIIRFYHGTLIYPNGWNRASNMFLASMPEGANRAKMEKRLVRLGVEIANEWAHDNTHRNINSNNMVTWGSALRTAAERNDHAEFITQVEDDVQALIARKLSSKDINYERYYPEEDYDDF